MKESFDIKEFALQLLAALLTFVLFVAVVRADEEIGWGDRGQQVRLIQQKLIDWGYMTGTADGVFGQKTYDGVVKFQRRNGLAADGIVGRRTAEALGISLGGSVSASAYNESESYMLARLIHGEARGEPYVGKVAVAAVVLNRVKSAAFPNTIAGVIFQAGAFDAVADGQYNLTPDADSIRAAKDALNGWDPTGGCLYYFNPATATSKWIWTRSIQLTIGKHHFAV